MLQVASCVCYLDFLRSGEVIVSLVRYIGMVGWARKAAAVLGESVFMEMCSSQAWHVYKAVSSCWVNQDSLGLIVLSHPHTHVNLDLGHYCVGRVR